MDIPVFTDQKRLTYIGSNIFFIIECVSDEVMVKITGKESVQGVLKYAFLRNMSNHSFDIMVQ